MISMPEDTLAPISMSCVEIRISQTYVFVLQVQHQQGLLREAKGRKEREEREKEGTRGRWRKRGREGGIERRSRR